MLSLFCDGPLENLTNASQLGDGQLHLEDVHWPARTAPGPHDDIQCADQTVAASLHGDQWDAQNVVVPFEDD